MTRRRIAWAVPVVMLFLAAVSAFACMKVGSFLAQENTLSRADAVFVLGGTRIERPLEAAELYREGYATFVVLSRDAPEDGMDELKRRGVAVPTNADLSRDMLLQLGVPAAALIVPSQIHDNTADEMVTLRQLVRQLSWSRVVVVSSRYHLRRAEVAALRALKGTGAQLVMRASRFDRATPARWWTRRSDIREIVSEVPKLAAYWMGLGT